jgi:hypothetical protein
MSSKSVNIVDYNKAIADGTIEGHFNSDRTVFHFNTVKSVNSKGAVLIWDQEVRLYDSSDKLHPIESTYLEPKSSIPDGLYGYIITSSKQISAKGVEGKVREGVKPTIIKCGKNLKKSNSTNPITQALRDALSKYNSQKHKGNNAVLSSVESSSFSTDNRPPPMLVKKIDETADATLTEDDVNLGLTVQRKYNGTRSPAHIINIPKTDSTANPSKTENTIAVDMYSRTNKDHLGLHHIKSELVQLFANAPVVPESFILSQLSTNTNMTSDGLEVLKLLYSSANLFVDGELYLHGKSLNWISGQVRKEGDEGTLEYWIYDCFFPAAIAAGYQMSSKHRQAYIDMLFDAANKSKELKYVKRVENYKVTKLSDIYKYRDEFLAEGYEGAIVRKDWAGYTYGKNNYHSSHLVKVKPIYDAEFKVVGFTQGTRGKDVGALIWVCEVDSEHIVDPTDKTFNVVPKDMTYEERYKIYELLNKEDNFNKYINGKYLTVEFPERSKKTGKPSQAKALNFRNLDTDSTEDPIMLLKNSK